ncbi:MAG: hypothetical protein ABMB14_27475 [Myxococcota bacterium]
MSWLLALAAVAWGGDRPADEVDEATGRPIRYRERTEVEFEGLKVDGEVIGPGTSLLTERPRPLFNPLIHLREDWNAELKASIDEIK